MASYMFESLEIADEEIPALVHMQLAAQSKTDFIIEDFTVAFACIVPHVS